MPISPLVPLVGLFIIAGNLIVAATRPYAPPVVMGVQLFIGGMTTLTIAVLDLLNPVGIGGLERFLLFAAGCINCSVGYYMVLLHMQRRA